MGEWPVWALTRPLAAIRSEIS